MYVKPGPKTALGKEPSRWQRWAHTEAAQARQVRQKETRRMRFATDPEYRERQREKNRRYNAEHRKKREREAIPKITIVTTEFVLVDGIMVRYHGDISVTEGASALRT